jgi:hypothetical protein
MEERERCYSFILFLLFCCTKNNHFVRFFFRDEPMNLAVNLLETPESRCEELEDYSASTIDQGFSVAAVDDNGEFVGLVINGLVTREVRKKKNICDVTPDASFPKE